MNSTKNTTKPVNEPSKKNRRDKAAAAAAAAGIAGAGAAYAAWPGSEDDAQAPEPDSMSIPCPKGKSPTGHRAKSENSGCDFPHA